MSVQAVREAEKQLLEALKESPVLQRFEAASKMLEGHEEEKRAIDDFRRKAYLSSNSNDPVGVFEDLEALYEERCRIYQNPRIAEFLQSEMELCRMLQRICTHVMEVADLQIEPFEDTVRM